MADLLKVAGITGVVAGGLLSIQETYQQGKLRRILNRHNANMREIEAGLVKHRTDQLIDRLNTAESRELAASRASSVGEGFALDSGTNLDIEGDIIKARATDRAIIRASGGLEEARLAIEADQDILSGEVARSAARVQTVRTLFGTTETLLKRFDKQKPATPPKLGGIKTAVR